MLLHKLYSRLGLSFIASSDATPRRATCEPLECRRLMAVQVYHWFEGNEQTAAGVQASWSDPGMMVDHATTDLTLTLSNIPEGYALRVSFATVGQSTSWPPGDTDTFSMEVNGQELYSTDEAAMTGLGGGGTIEEDVESSASVTFKSSGFEEGDVEWMQRVSVELLQYSIGLMSQTLTVDGESEEVTVTVNRDDGSPAEGVSVEIESLNSGIVRAEQSNVTTDGAGMATVDVTGIAPGYAMLQAKAGGGLAQAQNAALKIERSGTVPDHSAAIDDLDHEDPQRRVEAQASLINWGRQFPEVFDAVLAKKNANNNHPEMQARLEEILRAIGFSVQFSSQGPTIQFAQAYLPEGETVVSWGVWSTNDNVSFTDPTNGQEMLGLVDIAPTESVDMIAREAGEELLNFVVLIRQQDGNFRQLSGTLAVRVVDGV